MLFVAESPIITDKFSLATGVFAVFSSEGGGFIISSLLVY
jgi:hypothetical protein